MKSGSRSNGRTWRSGMEKRRTLVELRAQPDFMACKQGASVKGSPYSGVGASSSNLAGASHSNLAGAHVWDDIAGLEEAKCVMSEAVVLPMIMPDFFTGIHRPVNTMLAKAAATEASCDLVNIPLATLASEYPGESARMVRILFELARELSPTVIFVDQVESLRSQSGTANELEAHIRVMAELRVQVAAVKG
ncbi:Katanin p60 ATPase-containing subunit A-like 1 [Tetrabaena socialis]|uniref:Katanin p60 ATPase-containing subunit A-like 1 n=1 Tax=Tetrabaena socialis TaxID=47790 RepID=A0A2J7ZLI2_9CHLO|nr:Katanin p60 ATPase-containing subunit A-like 1 [Tetrabaena socialis]|eukprot:PNH01123.1 Katanin p60 ATPase-containing subunit A-like 1 [Tetrabaena socialis]